MALLVIDVSCGSLNVGQLPELPPLPSLLFGPIAPKSAPVDNKIPEPIPRFVELAVNVPEFPPVQFNVAFETCMPDPTIVVASAFALDVG